MSGRHHTSGIVEGERTAARTHELSTLFARSPYCGQSYAHWPLGRRIHAFLAAEQGIEDYEAVFMGLYSEALAARKPTGRIG